MKRKEGKEVNSRVRQRITEKLKQILIYGILIICVCFAIYPLLWMIGASLKLPSEVMASYQLWPEVPQWQTYAKVWQDMDFFRYFFNSLIITIAAVAAINIVYGMAGFAIAKLRFPGRKLIFIAFMGMMFVPSVTMLIPIYLTLNTLKLLDTHLGMILVFINGAAPFAVFLYRNYFTTIPHEIYEAAKVDGASPVRTLFSIYFPLGVPAMATITTMNVIAIWNNLSLPLIVLNSKELQTLPIAIVNLDKSAFRQWNVLMTGSLFAIIPVLILFFFLQKYYIQGLTAGSVKE